MGTKLTHRENANLMNTRISKRDIEQYFTSPSKEDVMDLIDALNKEDADDVADILMRNLRASADELNLFFEEKYDTQYIAIGKDLINDFLDEQIIKIARAIKNEDISELEGIREELDIVLPGGLKEKKNKLINEIDKALEELKIPDSIEEVIKKLAEERDFKITEDMIGRLESWKDGTKKLVIKRRDEKTGRFVWKALETLSNEEYKRLKKKKVKIEFEAPEKIKAKTIPEFRRDKKGKPLDFVEKKFIDSRLEDDFEEIYLDYTDEFGEVRTKTEFRKLVRGRR